MSHQLTVEQSDYYQSDGVTDVGPNQDSAADTYVPKG